ncbi:hypothetical protein B0H10DRAFT_1946361 [Mycena sp. CBHHK59/15]|nr:hypothetical protein B0H10DRAFT_1946361 [Mycena sp. CBHHK59/15]
MTERELRRQRRTKSSTPETATPEPTTTSFPSTPTISTPSDLIPSPETLPIPLPEFFTPAAAPRPQVPAQQTTTKAPASDPDDDMAPKAVELFCGNGTAEKAHTWLCTLEGTIKFDAEEKEKVYRFEKGLHPGGIVENGWNTVLTAAERKSWAALMAAFEKKWPKPKMTERDKEMVIRELADNYLDRSTLGQLVIDKDGTSVLSHVAWSEVVRSLLGEITGGDANMLLRSTIRSTLPVKFRTLIFLATVEHIPIDHINDAIKARNEQHRKLEDDIRAFTNTNPRTSTAASSVSRTAQTWANYGFAPLNGQPVPSTQKATRSTRSPALYIPPAARQTQPLAMTTTTPTYHTPPASTPRPYQTPQTPQTQQTGPHTPWANRGSPDIFGGSTIRPANSFAKSLLTTLGSPFAGRETLSGENTHDAEIARHIRQHPWVYTADLAGTQRYTADLVAWNVQNGHGTIPDITTYPLTPGTAGAGSKECFHCGMLTNPPHFGCATCETRNSVCVPVREYNIRKWAGEVLYLRSECTVFRVAQI